MNVEFETYIPRAVSKEEYVFWHEMLNYRSEISCYNWSCAPKEMKQLADRLSSLFDDLWVESNWQTGNDPALFGKKNDQVYLLARWGTDEVPLRTEEQLRISYRRRVEAGAVRDNRMLQAWWLLFEAILVIGGMSFLRRNDLLYGGVALFALALLLEVGRRWHKKRGLNRPMNIWEKKALDFIKIKERAA